MYYELLKQAEKDFKQDPVYLDTGNNIKSGVNEFTINCSDFEKLENWVYENLRLAGILYEEVNDKQVNIFNQSKQVTETIFI